MISLRQLALAGLIVVVALATFTAARRVYRGEKFYTLGDTVAVRSAVDGSAYRVHREHADAARAADALAETNARLTDLMRYLKLKYIRGQGAAAPETSARVRAVSKLLRRYNPDNLAENSPLDPAGDTSYTLDKGALIALCLRERDPKLKSCLKTGCSDADPRAMKLHDPKITTFVAIHELAHVAIDDVDHPPRFWETFKFLLQEARECGVLEGVRYDLRPVVYCGLAVDYNPLFDPNIPDIP